MQPVVLLRIKAEPGFLEAVAREKAPSLAKIADVKAAVVANALDSKRSDQFRWMKLYERMVGLDFLPDDPEGD